MDSFVDKRDYDLLGSDRYTFFVLKRIIGGEVKLLLSDHERLIICYTGHPFPVWIWTPDDASDEEMEKAYLLAKENELFSGKCSFNVKYALAEYFIKRAACDGLSMKILINMYAYDCPNPIKPEKRADGDIYLCRSEDLDELVSFMDMFHKEIGIDQKDIQGYRSDAESFIEAESVYFCGRENGGQATEQATEQPAAVEEQTPVPVEIEELPF